MKEKKTTELSLNATMTLNGIEVPLTATVDLLDYRIADAEAVHQMLSDDNAPPTLRETRRQEHLGTDKVVNRNEYSRKTKGTIIHAVAFNTIQNQVAPWTLVQSFTRYTKGYNQEDERIIYKINNTQYDQPCFFLSRSKNSGLSVEYQFFLKYSNIYGLS